MNEQDMLRKRTIHDVNCVLFHDTNIAVEAALELLKDKLGGSDSVYMVIKERLEANLEKTKQDTLDYFNQYIEKLNAARAKIAGPGCDGKAERDAKGCLDLGKSFYVPDGFIRVIGVRRIEETKAFEITINENQVEGTALPEKEAWRIYNALSAFYDAWKKEQHEKERIAKERDGNGGVE